MVKLNDLDHVEYIRDLITGDIDASEYLTKRGINQKGRIPEIIGIANKNPTMFNLFMAKVPVGIRITVMKEILKLNNREIASVAGSSKTAIGNFIKDFSSTEINEKITNVRNYSIGLFKDLSIILDLPYRYLNPDAEFNMLNSFDEYERTSIEYKTLNEVIQEGNNKVKDSNGGRYISGVKVKNDYFKNENNFLKTRLDIRNNYFSVEIHLENEASLNFTEIIKLQDKLNVRNMMYIRPSFLRPNYKLYIVITSNKSNRKPNIVHLDNEFYWRNVLFFVPIQTDRSAKNTKP